MEAPTKTPPWMKWMIGILFAIVIIFGVIIYRMSIKSDVKVKQTEQKKIGSEIDSLTLKRIEELTTLVENSAGRSQTGNQIIKTINHEKIIVRDNDYNSKCDSIANFEPNAKR